MPEQGDVHSIKPPAKPVMTKIRFFPSAITAMFHRVIANAVKQSSRHDVWIASFLAMTKIRFFPSAITAMFHRVIANAVKQSRLSTVWIASFLAKNCVPVQIFIHKKT
ncbi:MAG: hypothetical protein LBJ23_11355 [Tannerella sp.]|nr:hypothetical protein [Tannerella sp.]